MSNLTLPAITDEYVRIPVAAKRNGAAVDPTADDVELAFVLNGSPTTDPPEEDDWLTGSWETDPTTEPDPTYYARVIPDLTAGTYQPWVRVHDSPETVARPATNKLIIKP